MKQVIYIPCRDINGIPIDKFMRVVVGGDIYNQIMKATDGTLPSYMIVSEVDNATITIKP